MNTIDDAPEDNSRASDSFDDSDSRPIVRRSTYTAPAAPAAPVVPVVPVANSGPSTSVGPAATTAQPSAPPAPPTAGLPDVPQRRSLPDETLMNAITAAGNTGGTLEMMAELESQLHLREEEAQQYKNWEQTMLAVGTEEAIDTVRNVRPQFEDVVPDGPVLPVFMPRYPADPSAPAPAPVVLPAVVTDPLDPASATVSAPALAPMSAPPPLVEPPVAVLPPVAVSAVTGSMAIIPEGATDSGIVDSGIVDSGLVGSGPVDSALFEPVGATRDIPVSMPPTSGLEQFLQPGAEATWDGDDVADEQPHSLPAFAVERSGKNATPHEARSGHAVRMFWLWFAPNASILSIGFGATVLALGLSLRQSIVAILVGLAISCLPLGLATLAGKRSGQPTLIVSRAAFGIVGNLVPALLALVTRVFWGAVLLWLLATSVAFLLVGAQMGGPFGYDQLVLISLAAGFLIAILIAFFGYTMLARFQLVVTVVSFLLIGGLIFLTWPQVDFAAALSVPDGSWLMAATGAVLVFSYLGLVWAQSGSDLARYQRVGSSSGSTMLWSVVGASLPPFVLTGYGAVLAASDSTLAGGLIDRPLDVLAGLVPTWFFFPLIAAIAVSLLSGVVISLYSSGFAFQSSGIGLPRQWATIISGLLVAAVAWFLTTLDIDLAEIFRDLATTIAVPVAAWAGIFASDTMIRNRLYHEESLLSRGGLYPTIHWVNLPMFLLITGVGWGLTSASFSALSWQGYLFPYLGIPINSLFAATDIGVFLALVLGLMTPIVAGIPIIRRQESWQRS